MFNIVSANSLYVVSACSFICLFRVLLIDLEVKYFTAAIPLLLLSIHIRNARSFLLDTQAR